MRFILMLFITLGLLTGMAAELRAQNCDVVPEMIAKLRRPELGAYNLWDHIEGARMFKERYAAAAIIPENGEVIMAIERYAYNRQPKTIFLQQLDRRGRSEWLKELELKDIDSVDKLFFWGDELVMLANTKADDKSGVWIGFFDKTGALLRERAISDPKFSLSVTDGVIAHGGENLLVAVQTTPDNHSAAPSTTLHWLDRKGRSVKDRAFMLGLENGVSKIVATEDERYFLIGSIETADGRMAGWITYIDADGSLRWQRQYARGRGAGFNDAVLFNRGDFLALMGDAFPGGTDGGRRSGWVMVADLVNDGEPAWQRYYREDGEVYGRAVMADENGQITVLMDVQNLDDRSIDDYVRLVTLNPRGVILNSRSYQNGAGANAASMVTGVKREPIIYGSSMMVYTDEVVEPDGFTQKKQVRTLEAWAVAAGANDIYNDPCIQPYQFLP